MTIIDHLRTETDAGRRAALLIAAAAEDRNPAVLRTLFRDDAPLAAACDAVAEAIA